MSEESLREVLVKYKVALQPIQASERLGVVTTEEVLQANVQMLVADRRAELLMETKYDPIDIHTPMWLWSRGKFQVEI